MSPTILFVDDDRDLLRALSAFFQAAGFRVHTADTHDGALQALREHTPDVIVLDLMMEQADAGFVLGRQIRQDPRFERTPVLMLSGVAAATGRSFAGEGATLGRWSRLDAFLDKPITGKQLLKVVRDRLAERNGGAAAGPGGHEEE
jgi:CheY-like chemotaxis protein